MASKVMCERSGWPLHVSHIYAACMRKQHVDGAIVASQDKRVQLAGPCEVQLLCESQIWDCWVSPFVPSPCNQVIYQAITRS